MLPRMRRAPKACHWCHERKVRCDASVRGCPCTRCREDGRPECALRGNLPRYLDGLNPQNGQHHRNTTRQHVDPIISLIPDVRVSESIPTNLPNPLSRGHVAYTTFPFLELHKAASLPREDLAYMASTGCLSVPDKTAIDEFVRLYFLYSHPVMPVLDEAVFWEHYLHPDQEGLEDCRLSLFVFQALLFLGCTYVSLDTIQQCGFGDKRTARNAFYRRAKILFDLNGEDRAFARAQGSVLLTNHASAEEPQAGSVWLAYAIRNAMISGCKPGPCEDIEETLKKRLWWSIILRDRSLCLGLRRRSQITSVEFGMAAEPLDENDFSNEVYRSQVYDPAKKRLLVNVLREQCRLAVLLEEMTSSVFASHGLHVPLLTSEKFQKELTRVSCIEWRLQQWEIGFSLRMEQCPVEGVATLGGFGLTGKQNSTAHIDLAHYQALLVENHQMFAGNDYRKHLCHISTMLQHAVSRLTGIMEYFCRIGGSVQNLPLSVLANVVMPLVLSAVDMKLSSSSTEITQRRHLLDTMGEIVRRSGLVYDVADFVSMGTNHILQLAYMTSQNLFRRWNMDESTQDRRSNGTISNSLGPTTTTSTGGERISTDGEINSARRGASSNPAEKDSVQTPLSKTMSASRPTTWHEAFLQNPRGYLLISTSVDYSLSVGRLPYDRALPELVRCIPPMSIGITLPWTISAPSIAMGRHRHQQQKRISTRKRQRRVGETRPRLGQTTPKTTTPTDNIWDDDTHEMEPGQEQLTLNNHDDNRFMRTGLTPEEVLATANVEEGLVQSCQPENSTNSPINLDYFSLDDMLR